MTVPLLTRAKDMVSGEPNYARAIIQESRTIVNYSLSHSLSLHGAIYSKIDWKKPNWGTGFCFPSHVLSVALRVDFPGFPTEATNNFLWCGVGFIRSMDMENYPLLRLDAEILSCANMCS